MDGTQPIYGGSLHAGRKNILQDKEPWGRASLLVSIRIWRTLVQKAVGPLLCCPEIRSRTEGGSNREKKKMLLFVRDFHQWELSWDGRSAFARKSLRKKMGAACCRHLRCDRLKQLTYKAPSSSRTLRDPWLSKMFLIGAQPPQSPVNISQRSPFPSPVS